MPVVLGSRVAALRLHLRLQSCQVRGTVQRVQLDDQMPAAAHPVVLCPAGVATREANQEAGALLMPMEGPSPAAAVGPQPLIR